LWHEVQKRLQNRSRLLSLIEFDRGIEEGDDDKDSAEVCLYNLRKKKKMQVFCKIQPLLFHTCIWAVAQMTSSAKVQ